MKEEANWLRSQGLGARASTADLLVFGDDGPEEVLRLAASLDQVSPHVLAGAIVRAARARGLMLTFPDEVHEEGGSGILGSVGGRKVALGKAVWVANGQTLPDRARDVRRRSSMEGSSCVFVAVDGAVAGALVLDDPIRPDTPRVIRSLRRAGIRRVVMVTGDHADVAALHGWRRELFGEAALAKALSETRRSPPRMPTQILFSRSS